MHCRTDHDVQVSLSRLPAADGRRIRRRPAGALVSIPPHEGAAALLFHGRVLPAANTSAAFAPSAARVSRVENPTSGPPDSSESRRAVLMIQVGFVRKWISLF